MEITGKIIAVLPANSGVSARTGNPWMSQEFVIETHDQYPRKCCFRVFGEEKIKQFNIQSGEELTVSFDIDAHEYNGRWFNNITAWAVNRTIAQPAAGQQPMAAATAGLAAAQATADPFPQAQPASGNDDPFASDSGAGGDSADDLPF